MPRKLTVLIVGALLVALPAASATPPAERTKSGQYHVIAGNVTDPDPSVQGEFSNAVTFTPRDGERFVQVAIEDRTGLPTRALVVQEKEARSGTYYVTEQEICGSSSAPIEIKSHLKVRVLVQDGPCEDDTPAAATTGTVKVTFSR